MSFLFEVHKEVEEVEEDGVIVREESVKEDLRRDVDELMQDLRRKPGVLGVTKGLRPGLISCEGEEAG